MTNKEIARAWERAEEMAERIQRYLWTGQGKSQAIKDQKSLKVWLNIVKEGGIVYNGCYDELVEREI